MQPRRDTNELSHELIEECGSLFSVLESPEERLCRVSAVGEQTALYLKLLGELTRRYAIGKSDLRKDPMQVVYDSPEKIAALMFPRFLGHPCEQMYALLFDAGMHLSDVFCVGEGTINSVSVTARAVAQRAYQRNAASVVLAHNHPGGVASPSVQDIELTRGLREALALVGVPLLEHFVFTEHAYFPILAGCGSELDTQGAVAAQAAQIPVNFVRNMKGK